MTNEQWLVYLYGIYPQGGFMFLWIIALVAFIVLLIIASFTKDNFDDSRKENKWYYKKSCWYKLGNWKWIVPSFLSIMLLLSNLVPDRNTFMYLVATPYIVDSGKTLIEQLDDNTSKVYKLNKLLDKGLDKALKELEE